MSKINEKGVLIFYDWLDRLREADLDAEDALSVIYALADYSRRGENPVDKFKGTLQCVVGLMFDQIKRAEATAEAKAENARRTNEKKRANAERTLSERRANAERTLSDTTNTNTHTQTGTDTINIPPYNPPKGKTTTTTLACAKDEDKKRIEQVFSKLAKNGENLEDFIAYNDARGWLGIGGEDILKDDSTLARYVRRWLKYETPSAEDESPKVQPTKYISFDPNEALQRAVEKSLNKRKESESL